MRESIKNKIGNKIAKTSLKFFLAGALTMGYIMIQISNAREERKRYNYT